MVFLELTGMKIAILVTLLFGIALLYPTLNLLFRFSGKLKEAGIFLALVLLAVITGGILRLFELIPSAYYQHVTVFLSFVITFFLFLTIVSLRVMIKNIDYNNHYNLRDNHINFHDPANSKNSSNAASDALIANNDYSDQEDDLAPEAAPLPARMVKRKTIVRHTSATYKKYNKLKERQKNKNKKR